MPEDDTRGAIQAETVREDAKGPFRVDVVDKKSAFQSTQRVQYLPGRECPASVEVRATDERAFLRGLAQTRTHRQPRN